MAKGGIMFFSESLFQGMFSALISPNLGLRAFLFFNFSALLYRLDMTDLRLKRGFR